MSLLLHLTKAGQPLQAEKGRWARRNEDRTSLEEPSAWKEEIVSNKPLDYASGFLSSVTM